MTSGNFTYLAVDKIQVDRETRQRKELTNIEELADSIRRVGLINPIVITRDNVLVAGERRLTAHKLLRFEQIAVQYTDELDEKQLQLIELEENVKRVDLSWQDRVAAVAKFDALKRAENPNWSAEKTAQELNMSSTNVQRYVQVNGFLDAGNEQVACMANLSQAVNYVSRALERKKTSAIRDLFDEQVAVPTPRTETGIILPGKTELQPAPVTVRARRSEILNTDFTEWCKNVQAEPFNLIHCDFPYGINTGNNKRQRMVKIHGSYDDSAELYFSLVETFIEYQDNFVGPSAHMIFWFDMNYYTTTVDIFKEAGWRVNSKPLIWSKGNTGLIPDPNRTPRQVYETALFMTRGDRKIVRAVGNHISAEVTKDYHTTEKAKKMLEHFLRMLVDESTLFLDPTCGSGNSVITAERLGAHYALGLEKDKSFHERATDNWRLSEL